MPRPRQFTIGAAMLAIAATGIVCAGLLTLKSAWAQLSELGGLFLLDLGSGPWLAIMVFLGPFLLWGFLLVLFPIRTEEPEWHNKPANSDLDDL